MPEPSAPPAAARPPTPTHRPVVNADALSCDVGDPTIAVENAVVGATFDFASAAHVAVDESMLSKSWPAGFEAWNALDPVQDGERRFDHETERRATLGDERHVAAVETLLDFAENGADGDAWPCRLFGVDELAVVEGDEWRYRSVPHHLWLRDVYVEGDGSGGDSDLLAAVDSALGRFPGAALFPVDADGSLAALAAWRVAGPAAENPRSATDSATYEVTPEHLVVDGESRRAFGLGSLAAVRRVPARRELVFGWKTAGRGSLPRRLLGRVVDRFTADPPTRLRFEREADFEAATAALETLRARLDYGYRLA